MILGTLQVPAWTAEELATLRAAVASGVLTVSYAGPPSRSVTYQSLDAMRALLAEMDASVNPPTAVPFRLARSSKGLGC